MPSPQERVFQLPPAVEHLPRHGQHHQPGEEPQVAFGSIRAEAKGELSPSGRSYNETRQTAGLQGLPMLSLEKSAMQRHRAWRTLHQLQAGRSRVHRL
jgi:hypothetical protein